MTRNGNDLTSAGSHVAILNQSITVHGFWLRPRQILDIAQQHLSKWMLRWGEVRP
jgi:hypothetical protein